MTRVVEALREGATYLQHSGSPSARLDAEVLLAHALDVRRIDLYLQPERFLPAENESTYRSLLQRRGRGEPVSYLLGRKEFFGLTFAVDRRVIVPRPETELLVEKAVQRARTLAREDPLIADIGTGSGCIAVALAWHLPQAHIYATEISPEAAQVARGNAGRHSVTDRVIVLQGNLCAPLPEPVDLLVANPPYTIWNSLPPGITDYEPRLALDGGADGLEVYRQLLPSVPAHLRPGGAVLLEVGDGQASAVLSLARECLPGMPTHTWKDLSGVERVVEIGPGSTNSAAF